MFMALQVVKLMMLKNEKEQKRTRTKNIQEELNNYKKQSETTKEYIAKLDGAMSELDGQIYDVNNNIERLTQEIEETQNNLDIAIEDADEQYKMMKLLGFNICMSEMKRAF